MSKEDIVKILIAIIGLIGVVSAAFIGQEIVIDLLLSRTTISIPAATDYSGVSSGPTLHHFDGTSDVVAFGDTTANNSVRAFLGFPLGSIPRKAEVINASLIFNCDLYGNPNTIGRFWMKEYAFYPYNASDYTQIEKANMWKVSWPTPSAIMNSCLSSGTFKVETNSLPLAVQENIASRYFQLAFILKTVGLSPMIGLTPLHLQACPC